MPNILTDVGLLASQNRFLAYFIIYLATIFIGNISAFAGFWIIFRASFGAWSIPLLALTIFLADISGDLLWYSLGLTLRDTRFGNFIHNRIPNREKIEAKVQKNGKRLLFMSKFMYSAFPVIFSIGWCRVGFKKFFRASLLSVLLWIPILLGLAYGLIAGLSPLGATAIFKRFEILFVVGIALFLVADYFLAKIFKKIFRNGNGFYNGKGKESSAFSPDANEARKKAAESGPA